MRRVIISITGASGVIYGIRALELLRTVDDVETHAIITPSAYRTALAEVNYSPDDMRALADHLYNHKDIGAAISSGSFHTDICIKLSTAIASSRVLIFLESIGMYKSVILQPQHR